MALQWCSDAYADTLVGFANSIRTADGGTHLDGMRAALTRTVNALGEQKGQSLLEGLPEALSHVLNGHRWPSISLFIGKKQKLLKEGESGLQGDHIREGLCAIVSVKVGGSCLRP